MPDPIEQLHAKLMAGQNLSGPDRGVAKAFLEATAAALDEIGNSTGIGNLGGTKRELAREFGTGRPVAPAAAQRLREIIEKYHAFRGA